MVGDDATQVRSRVVLRYFAEGNPAEKVSLTDKELARPARDIGVHRENGPAGKARARLTEVRPQEITRTRDIVGVAQILDGTTAPDIDRLTDVRRAADILTREYGHTGPLRPEHLDPLARTVLGLALDAPVSDAQRRHLLGLVKAAKKSRRPVTSADLTAAARAHPVPDPPAERA
jgi:hypothetical protein